MILPKKTDALHLAWMYRILSAIADDPVLVTLLRFKGGTCAAMREIINRFSIDLDFDLINTEKILEAKNRLEIIYKKLGLTIKDKSKNAPQYFLRYPKIVDNPRNGIKIDVTFPPAKNDAYEPVRFAEIDRVLQCQTIPTMFAHKLIAIVGRFERTGSIAARDLFDVHTFFIRGNEYKEDIIKEVRGKNGPVFCMELYDFVKKYVTQQSIDQDLNVLLTPQDFQRIRKILKQETLMLLKRASEGL